jgi:hypothetical protein
MYTQDMYVYISLCCHHAATFNEKSNVHALSTLPSTPLRPPLHIYTYSFAQHHRTQASFQRAELLVFQRMRTFRSTAEQLPRAGFFLSHFFPAPLQSRVFDVGDVLIESLSSSSGTTQPLSSSYLLMCWPPPLCGRAGFGHSSIGVASSRMISASVIGLETATGGRPSSIDIGVCDRKHDVQ